MFRTGDWRTSVGNRKVTARRWFLSAKWVMFTPIEKPKDKGEVRYLVGIMLGPWTGLTKLSLERQSEESKLAPYTACRQGSGGDA